MNLLFQLILTAGLALGACSPTPKAEVHYIPMDHTSIFKIKPTPQHTVEIDSTLFCDHEVTMFIYRPDSVFLVDQHSDTTGYKIQRLIQSGVYLLSDDTPMPVVMTIMEFPYLDSKPKYTVYFLKGKFLLRFSQHTNIPCDIL